MGGGLWGAVWPELSVVTYGIIEGANPPKKVYMFKELAKTATKNDVSNLINVFQLTQLAFYPCP